MFLYWCLWLELCSIVLLATASYFMTWASPGLQAVQPFIKGHQQQKSFQLHVLAQNDAWESAQCGPPVYSTVTDHHFLGSSGSCWLMYQLIAIYNVSRNILIFVLILESSNPKQGALQTTFFKSIMVEGRDIAYTEQGNKGWVFRALGLIGIEMKIWTHEMGHRDLYIYCNWIRAQR